MLRNILVLALLLALIAIPVDATTISIESGDGQTGVVGTSGALIIVRVTEDEKSKLGASVFFSISSYPVGAMGMRLSTKLTHIGHSETAWTVLTFGDKIGTYTVSISTHGASTSVSATAITQEEADRRIAEQETDGDETDETTDQTTEAPDEHTRTIRPTGDCAYWITMSLTDAYSHWNENDRDWRGNSSCPPGLYVTDSQLALISNWLHRDYTEWQQRWSDPPCPDPPDPDPPDPDNLRCKRNQQGAAPQAPRLKPKTKLATSWGAIKKSRR